MAVFDHPEFVHEENYRDSAQAVSYIPVENYKKSNKWGWGDAEEA